MAKQYEFIRRFEEKAEPGYDVLFAAPSQSYLAYWIRELHDYLMTHTHENHTPTIHYAENRIGYKGGNVYFKVFQHERDIDKIRGLSFKDYYEPGGLPVYVIQTIRARVR